MWSPKGQFLLLFSLYMLPLSQIMRNKLISYHSYADDTQIYLALSPNDYSPIDSLCQCIDEMSSWMCQNFLQLNKETKMKFSRWKYTLTLGFKQQNIKSKIFLQTNLNFSSHVKAVTKSAYYHLKNIARIISFVSSQDLEKLVHVFITSRVDYCTGLLTGLPRRPLDICSSSRTLLPGFWLEPENLSISHQSSGPYTGFQLHLGLILKYSFINHSKI